MRKTIKIIFLCIGIVALCIVGYNVKESVRIKRIVRFHAAEQPAIASDLPDSNTSKHIVRAVQQIMIGTLCNNYDNAFVELQKVAPGETAYDIIIKKTNPLYVNTEIHSPRDLQRKLTK